MNKEIGGYIQFDNNHGEMFHDNAIYLNCGRRAFSYLIKSKNIKKVWIPKFSCDSIASSFRKENCEINYYSVNDCFEPVLKDVPFTDYVVVINYYGQISNSKIKMIARKYPKLIVDNTQAYFQMPLKGIDTIYSCRKFFGVSDGAILYTNKTINEKLEIDESYKRMTHILGRYERSAPEFYDLYIENDKMFEYEPIKMMSRLTENILRGVDYRYVSSCRKTNYSFLNQELCDINKLKLTIPDGSFMYPFYVNDGDRIREELLLKKIYIPILWPDVFDICNEEDIEYKMARNILPLPVDQRYGIEDMSYVIKTIKEAI